MAIGSLSPSPDAWKTSSYVLETKQGLPTEWRAYARPAEGRSETGSPADTRGRS